MFCRHLRQEKSNRALASVSWRSMLQLPQRSGPDQMVQRTQNSDSLLQLRGSQGGKKKKKGSAFTNVAYTEVVKRNRLQKLKGMGQMLYVRYTKQRKKLDPSLSLKEKTLKPFRVKDCDTDGKGLKQMGWNGIWKMTTIRNGTGKETHQQSRLCTEEVADRESIRISSSAQPTVLKTQGTEAVAQTTWEQATSLCPNIFRSSVKEMEKTNSFWRFFFQYETIA